MVEIYVGNGTTQSEVDKNLTVEVQMLALELAMGAMSYRNESHSSNKTMVKTDIDAGNVFIFNSLDDDSEGLQGNGDGICVMDFAELFLDRQTCPSGLDLQMKTNDVTFPTISWTAWIKISLLGGTLPALDYIILHRI
ncbi:uncharacterized protein [Amphiura filiformis]|uniref:uncharacterized protein n=1 Tax=Amphiura filiformis TaxID=82378 RepID=UPI003B225A62